MRIPLNEAAELLKTGHVIGVPTETVYGLAASLSIPEAIQKIYTIKGRPANNPLIIHVADFAEIFSFVQGSVYDLDVLNHAFWPGPLTVVLPVKCDLIPAIARADLPTAAFRIPLHPLALNLLKLTGPLVMPSANISGRPSSTGPEHVEQDFGLHFPVLDGGKCDRGLESTILAYNQNKWEIIRQGALPAEHFASSLGYTPEIREKIQHEVPLCPGQMYRHYAPKAKLKLVDSFENIKHEVIIGFSDRTYPSQCHVLALGPLSKPELAAANLYSVLRQLDQEGHSEAYVDFAFPKVDILSTLAERLFRAAKGD